MGRAEWRRLRARLVRSARSPECVIIHLGIFLVAGTILVVLNAIRDPAELWFWQPLLGLGALLALHALLIIAAGHTSRLRYLALLARAGWSRAGAVRPPRTVLPGREASPFGRLRTWAHEQRPRGAAAPGFAPQAAAPIAVGPTQGAGRDWAETEPFTSWPAAPAAAGDARAWSQPAPAWSASWPAPATPARAPVRPTGNDTVVSVALASDASSPSWDQLEVAASTWLAHRAADAAIEHPH